MCLSFYVFQVFWSCNLACIYVCYCLFEKAEQHLIDAKRILDKSQMWPRNGEPDDENWSASMGMLQHAMGKYVEAERLLKMLKDVLKRQEPHQDKGERPQRFFATTVSLYASTCTALGDYETAKTYFLKALELRKSVFGPMHPHVAASLNLVNLEWPVKTSLQLRKLIGNQLTSGLRP